MKRRLLPPGGRALHRGMSLLVVLVVLLVIAVLGSAAARITVMSGRGARNERDTQGAWQAAEAALADAERDLRQPSGAGRSRSAIFGGAGGAGGSAGGAAVDAAQFVAGCGTAGRQRGLCLLPIDAGSSPAWLAADFMLQGDNAPTVALGEFTGMAFASSAAGSRQTRPPRYLIELVPDEGGSRDLSIRAATYVFRVTAAGFGPRGDEMAVVQAVFRH